MQLASFSTTTGRPVASESFFFSGIATQPGTLVRLWTIPFSKWTKPGTPTPMASIRGCLSRRSPITRSMASISASGPSKSGVETGGAWSMILLR